MKINKLINNLHYLILLLIPCGWVLNWKYYFSRFTSEGFDSWLCIMISIILVVFASSVFAAGNYFKNQNKKIWILFLSIYCVLAFYSINCTTAGQYWDQQKENEKHSKSDIEISNQSYQIDEYKKSKIKAEKEYDNLNAVKDSSIKNLDDLWTYEEEAKNMENKKGQLKKEIEKYQSKIDAIIKENKTSVIAKENKKRSKSLYLFYAGGNNKKAISVQLIFQILLSIIIEMIAQVSIYIFMNIQKTADKENKMFITQNELRHFTVLAWEGISRKQSKILTEKTILLKNIKKLSKTFNELKYRQIIKIALKHALIKKKNKSYIPGNGFITSDFFYIRMCEILRLKT